MKILDVRVDGVTRKQAILALNQRQIIFTPNPEILLEAQKNNSFKTALGKGSLMLPDGHGLLLVSTLLAFPKMLRIMFFFPAFLLFLFYKKPFQKRIPELIHGSDFMLDLLEWAEFNKKSVFFLGGTEGVAARAAKKIMKKLPHLKIAGCSHEDPSEKSFERVRAAKPDVILVAYGAPKQELWIAQYASQLPHAHFMGVGGSFDFWSGKIKRAPLWMRRLGLEWFWRLLLHPRQRARRIWNALIRFPLLSLFS